MNGVIVLSARTGACLYAQSYREDFGLPSSSDHHVQQQHFSGGSGGGARTARGGASSPAAMQLAGLIFALDMHAAELVTLAGGDDDDADGGLSAREMMTASDEDASGQGEGREGGNNNNNNNNHQNELRRWAVGDCVLHFRKDRRRHVLVVVSSAVGMGDDVPAQLAREILTGFVAKHAKSLEAPGGPPPGKSLKFTSELHAAFQTKPAKIARDIVRKLGLRSPWVYAALSDEMLLNWGRGARGEWDDNSGRGGGGGGGNDGDGENLFGAAPGSGGGFGGGGGGGSIGIGRSSGIPFREKKNDGGGGGDRGRGRGGGGGGWFCMGNATAVSRLVSSHNVGAVQFIHRITPRASPHTPPRQEEEQKAGECAPGTLRGNILEKEKEKETASCVDDIMPHSALEGLIATVHAAATVMETLPSRDGSAGGGLHGGSGGLRSMEVEVKDTVVDMKKRHFHAGDNKGGEGEGESGGGGGGGGSSAARVVVYCWDNFLLALPITAADVENNMPTAGATAADVDNNIHTAGAGAEDAGAGAGASCPGGLGLHPAVVRGAVHEDMQRLHRLLRFVESAVPKSKLNLQQSC